MIDNHFEPVVLSVGMAGLILGLAESNASVAFGSFGLIVAVWAGHHRDRQP